MSVIFNIAIFLSAFLLFIIQPLLTKKLLPLFGSAPSVWLCHVLFFQSALLLGYIYAFLLTRISQLSYQILIHLFAICATLFYLPLHVPESLSSQTISAFVVTTELAKCILLPSILISATSPLLQNWYNLRYQKPPYRFYALSNFGCLLGLLTFPFVLEPFMPLSLQLHLWSGFYVIYLFCTAGCLFLVNQSKIISAAVCIEKEAALLKTRFIPWIGLSLLSTTLLMSTTQMMMQSVVNFPLLWIIPLILYLISFIIIFAYPNYLRFIWMLVYAGLCAIVFYYPSHHQLTFVFQLLLYAGIVFAGCLVCHGELYRLKPTPHFLTQYYLAIALGGVFGGVLINFIFPYFLSDAWDFYISVWLILCVCGWTILSAPRWIQLGTGLAWVISVFSCIYLFQSLLKQNHQNVVFHQRDFFGTFEVNDNFPNTPEHYRTLYHGNILHGMQYFDPERSQIATSYYSAQSGIGQAIHFQRLCNHNLLGLRIGVIGLGAGTIAALATKGDRIRFYEIDPKIEHIAKNYFTYLKNSQGTIDVVIQDGRLALNQALALGSENYDVLAIDAFTGDAIPIHLLTLEAVQLYTAHLASNGILAFHVSNRYINLYPPLQAIANELKLFLYITQNENDIKLGISSSEWMLLTKNGDLGPYLFRQGVLDLKDQRMQTVWTDDYNYLLSVVRW